VGHRIGRFWSSVLVVRSDPARDPADPRWRWLVLWRRDRRTALSFLGVNGGLFLPFSAYRLWDQSYWGNRFLLTIALTSAVPLAVGIEALRELGRNPANAAEKSE
jgi:hypothetical protein